MAERRLLWRQYPEWRQYPQFWTKWEWRRSLDDLDRALMPRNRSLGQTAAAAAAANLELRPPTHCRDRNATRCAHLLAHATMACGRRNVRRRCARSCGACPGKPLSPSAPPCTLVATRHVAKTGGASVRDWMLQLEKHGHGRFFGPVTWMRYRGRCDGNKKFLHCCHPRDPRPVNECEQVQTRLDDSTRLDSTRLDSTPLDLARHGLT